MEWTIEIEMQRERNTSQAAAHEFIRGAGRGTEWMRNKQPKRQKQKEGIRNYAGVNAHD
jgi:hypothetical protein